MQQQKEHLEQRLQKEIADLHEEQQQAASEAANSLQVDSQFAPLSLACFSAICKTRFSF